MGPSSLINLTSVVKTRAMIRTVDENWKRIQETTFTNWINSSFRSKLKTSHKQVQSLQTDLQDGTILAELLENISMKTVGPYNKNPTIKAVKVENLGTCFRFLEREKVKVVNIGKDLFGDTTEPSRSAPPTVLFV